MKELFVFGDSYSGAFSLLNEKSKYRDKLLCREKIISGENYKIQLNKCSGRTLKGITKNTSKIQEIILKTVEKEKNNIESMVFMFGQVDTQRVYYYDVFVKKIPYNFNVYIEKYVRFISQLKLEKNKKVIILPIPNASGEKEYFQRIKKNYNIPKLSYTQRYYHFSIKKREERRKRFNDCLKNFCKIYDVLFLDFDRDFFDKSGNLKEKFKLPNRFDHHLVWEYQLEVMTKKLKKFGFPIYKAPKKETVDELIKSYYNFK